MMTKLFTGLVLLLVSFTVSAQNSSTVEQEIADLISSLETSNCIFHRNGSTHTAIEAAEHLRLKLLRARRYATTTELFIDRLASKSSFSGKPYLIECKSGELTELKAWLDMQLLVLRN